jgi:hypothetical protein
MASHALKLLVLAALVSVAPAAAHQSPSVAGAKAHGAECPYARASHGNAGGAWDSDDALAAGGSILSLSTSRHFLP